MNRRVRLLALAALSGKGDITEARRAVWRRICQLLNACPYGYVDHTAKLEHVLAVLVALYRQLRDAEERRS